MSEGGSGASAPVGRRKRAVDEAVKSAEGVAFIRSLGALEDDERIRCPDHLAVHFLSPGWLLVRRPLWLFKRVLEWWLPGCYGHHIARTKRNDELLLEAVTAGAKQIVILGAGNDTRPYRFRRELSGVRIFELDLPGTQAVKKAHLKDLYGALPGHVTYVAIDFNTQGLEQTLMDAGYDPKLLTFFLWEGVCCFLPEEAVEQILRFVARCSAPGSMLAFDYSLRSFVEGDLSTYGAKELFAWNERAGEPHLFGLAPGQMALFVEARGLELVSDLSPDEAERRYLTRGDGSQLARMWGMLSFACARVPGQR